MKQKTLYEELGVETVATKEEIKRAYRKKAAKLHPDVNKDPDAEEQFKRVCEAYMILYDDQSRYRYDSTGYEEKPTDRKPVDVEEAAKAVLYRAVFSTVDKLGEQVTKRNLQNVLKDTLMSMKKEVQDRLRNNKQLWKAAKRKKAAVVKKQVNIQRDSLLYKILDTKLKHIDTQEILPAKENMRQLLIDKATVKRALEFVNTDCIDNTVEDVEIDLMATWDQQMRNTFPGFGSITGTAGGPF